MKILFFFLPFCMTDSLPPASQLYAGLDTFHYSKLSADLAAFSDKVQPAWMNYIPSVGIGYTPAGDPRPTLSFSLSQVISARQRKLDTEAQRQTIQATSALELQADRLKLRNLLLRHESETGDLQFMQQLFDIDEELFQFYEAQAGAHELTPSELLKRKKDFLESEQEIRNKRREILLLEMEVLEHARFGQVPDPDK